MYIAILGRQPALGMAELEHLYGSSQTAWFSEQTATIKTDSFSIERLGGTQKAGQVVIELPRSDWHRVSQKIVQAYTHAWSDFDGKITLGISVYGFDISPREVQKTGIILKQKLKKADVSLRLIPNTETVLNTATSHHNKLGLSNNKVELIVVRSPNGRVIVAESTGAQNITALAKRDQERPKRDAFVGMLPPKLAQMMINLATPDTGDTSQKDEQTRILDPFCGTGVILQEAALMGHAVYGTDLADKMVKYSQANLEWLATTHHVTIDATVHGGDAMDTKWQPPINAVVCESYLGQPFSAPPSPAKLTDVRKNCNYIISTFLKNISTQIAPGTPLCIAIPAWRSTNNDFTHLPFVQQLESLGYTQYDFKNVSPNELLYHREDQIVARELLVLIKT
ncbi:MAG TPA: DNA methyltransferase [Candidatus Saccharimonadales bacterium]|nr:DNA methyltransferase [Candidatus Saccharimonadales bacterium]